ncbi:MAG: aldo/keto reductase [Ignavibacteriae bacterium]|nr:aldo/keto reductase [Ignavibacteriota bacterium]NOG99049.1 aldo/keto reductase [Ignavibacteriota bacterium]
MIQKDNILGKTNLRVSPIGFGGYRIDNEIEMHANALKFAIENGINLIDTSSNYSNGGSEVLIGNVVKKLISDSLIARDDLVIVSKAGYIQGDNIKLLEQKINEGEAYEEVVRCTPELYHSINPRFISDQVELSLRRLKLDYIDLFLLHNPEYFLLYTKERDADALRDEYYRRIKSAFAVLEHLVEIGKIRHYGISSNTFIDDSDKRKFTSLEKLIELANSISPNNHFSVVQTPINLIEKDAANNFNQKNNTKTFLQIASENNIGVLGNRPLNAIEDGKLIRLTDYEIEEDRTDEEIKDLLKQQQKLELEIINDYSQLFPEHQKNDLIEFISLSKFLKANIKKFTGVTHFNDVKSHHLIPQINYAINEIYTMDPDNQKTISKLNHFAVASNILLNSIASLYAAKKNEDNKKLHSSLSKYFNDPEFKIPLSQKAIKMVTALPEVSTVLVGMRRVSYVKDIIEAYNLPEIENASNFWHSN